MMDFRGREVLLAACLLLSFGGARLVVVDAMGFVCEPNSVVASPGEELTLCCSVDGPAKLCTWYWTLAYSQQEPRTLKKFAPIASAAHGPASDCSLVVRTPLTEDNPKELFCEVLSEDRLDGVESRVAVITVSRTQGGAPAPRLTVEPQGVTARHGDAVVLECAASAGLAGCEWATPYGAVFVPQAMDKSYTLLGDWARGNCSLRIAAVHVRDEGEWRCKIFVDVAASPAESRARTGATSSGGLVHELESRPALLKLQQVPGSFFPDPSDEELFGVPRSVVIGGAVLGLVALVAGGVFAVPSLRQAVLRRVSRRQRNKIDVERNLLAPVTIQAINQRLRNEQHHQRDREGATADIGNKPQVVALGDVVRVLPPAVAPRPDHSLASQEDAIYIQPANVYENLRPGAAPPSPPPPPPPQQQQHRTRNTIYANLRAQFLSSSSSLSPTEATSNTRQSQQRPPLRPKPNKAAINNKTRSSSGGGHVNVGADLRDDASVAAAGATAAAVSASAGTSRRASKPSGSAIYAAVKKFEGR